MWSMIRGTVVKGNHIPPRIMGALIITVHPVVSAVTPPSIICIMIGEHPSVNSPFPSSPVKLWNIVNQRQIKMETLRLKEFECPPHSMRCPWSVITNPVSDSTHDEVETIEAIPKSLILLLKLRIFLKFSDTPSTDTRYYSSSRVDYGVSWSDYAGTYVIPTRGCHSRHFADLSLPNLWGARHF